MTPMLPRPAVLMRPLLILGGTIFILHAANGDMPGAGKALPIDQHWQLFLDDYIVARSTGFDRVLHHPRAMGVVIPADNHGKQPELKCCMARRSDAERTALSMRSIAPCGWILLRPRICPV